ncbi:hypothetical protein ABTB22_19365, partial [Acinetobacter baumannii]
KVLIDRFPLVPIKNDEHLDEAHEVAQSLMGRQMATDEAEYLEVLLDEIGRYESKHHVLKLSDLPPHDLLRSFIKDHGLTQVAMQEILGVSS